MTLRNRFLLVGFGVFIFLVITPALVLYARGFQVDWKNKTFVKTGALVVKTEPTKAKIFINDEESNSTTPANIRFLLPDDYNIRIEKEGYQSWTKRLSVKSQLVTWTNLNREFITLFFTNAKQEYSVAVKAASISRNADEIIYVSPSEVGDVNIKDGDFNTIVKANDIKFPLLSSSIEIKWHDASKTISLLANKNILNLLEKQISSIQHIETNGEEIVGEISNNLYLVTSNGLVEIDTAISDFTMDNDDIWYIQGQSLKHFNLNSSKSELITSILPLATKNKIIRTNNQIYLILDSGLYLFNGNLEKIYSNVNYASWEDGQLLYANDNEIYLYQPNTKDSTLILRSLTAIQNPIMNSQTGFVFYQNEGKIKAIELDGRDHRNIFTIADALELFTVSSDGKLLYTISDSEIKKYRIR